ncbi:MAG: cobalamin-dependent protein, partial [Acidobacteriota bacterium]
MGSIGNLICLHPRDSYLIDSPMPVKGFLSSLERRTGPFLRSPGIGFPYLVGFFRKNGVIPDSTRIVVQHDQIEGVTPFQNIIDAKVDLSRGDCDVLFITAYTNSVREAYRRAREAREAYRSIGRPLTVVLGGAHASAVPTEGTRFGHVDAVVAGEGEWAASELLTDIQEGREVRPLYRAAFNRIRDKNSLAIDMGIWRELRPTPQQIISSTTFARGCKLDCSFCAVKLTNGETVRNRDYSDVVKEIRNQGVPFDRESISGAPASFFTHVLKKLVR